MSVTIKPKQALGFLPARNCICNSPYCQPILTTDSLMLQGTVDEATGINRLINGEFTSSADWTLGAGFSIAGGKLVATNISGTTAFSGSLGLTVGKIYLVQFALTVTSAGSATAGQGWYAQINGNSLQLPDSTPLGDGFNESLTASWIYSPTAITSDNFLFTTDENTIDFEVEYVRVYELSKVGLALYRDAVQVDDITSFTGSNFIKYYFNGTHFMTGSTLVSVTNILYESVTSVTAMFELYIDTWASVTSETGCLTARFYDTTFSTTAIRNGDFTSDLSFWDQDVSMDWAWSLGTAVYTWSGFTQGTLSQTIGLEGGNTYTLTFNNGGDVRVRLSINGAAAFILGTYTTGDNTATIDLTDYEGLTTVEVIFGENPSYHANIILDLVAVTAEPDTLNETNCLNIQTEWPCTILLYAINFDNAFGLNYTTGDLQHWLRVYGKIKYSDYPEDAEVFKFSDNSNQIMFASSEKEYEVIVGDAPEQIHDCIAILRLHDIFQIDGYSFVRSGNYDLNRRRTSDNSQAVFTVKEQQGVSSNYSCQ